MEIKFKVGDVVQLNTDGIELVVTAVNVYGTTGLVDTVWIHDGEVKT